ncbi:hypothetical protein QFZ77_004717 [Paenibacillus sp. V4I3]|uniref:DUF4367 domain-containing protein n=1 Tax=Paenibacillus sp. V4I3 TaxID=3042305 RepID=UPI0027834204|nr:DUF4367 domain-containing protein [Paenibacillus sp. V4I3]MDQ0876058.1 hypothetical protein [Paenibacillus sp. V4I3]
MLKSIALSFSILSQAIFGFSIHDDTKIQELKKHVTFNLFIPSYFDKASNYEIKVPDQINKSMPKVQDVMINYFDSNGAYVFGVQQIQKARKLTIEPRGEKVVINGGEGWYEVYVGKEPTGGRLKWLKSGTYLELETHNLSKDALIKIAKSMKVIK